LQKSGVLAIRPLVVATDRGRVPTKAERRQASQALLSVGFAGTRRRPPSWVEAKTLPGTSGYWVGRSGERFAVELLSDRESGASALLPGNHL
jgi:hypothetical protein